MVPTDDLHYLKVLHSRISGENRIDSHHYLSRESKDGGKVFNHAIISHPTREIGFAPHSRPPFFRQLVSRESSVDDCGTGAADSLWNFAAHCVNAPLAAIRAADPRYLPPAATSALLGVPVRLGYAADDG